LWQRPQLIAFFGFPFASSPSGWLDRFSAVRPEALTRVPPSVLLSIIKNGDASTLTVVNAVKRMLEVARSRSAGYEHQIAVRPVGLRRLLGAQRLA
jgi:hypothetical protein